MTHRMKLWHEPFVRIREGSKTIEMRLLDEKRSKIAVGDAIVFEDRDSGDTVSCLVLALHRYPTFAALYARHDKVTLGYDRNEPAFPEDMLTY